MGARSPERLPCEGELSAKLTEGFLAGDASASPFPNDER